MRIPLKIYLRAVGIYLLLTLPLLMNPGIYFISMLFVLMFGWYACLMFMIIFFSIRRVKSYLYKMAALFIAVIPCVASAYHILLWFHLGFDARDYRSFLLFPATAVIAGWISLVISSKAIRKQRVEMSSDGKVNVEKAY